MQQYLFILTLGPVQSFIAQARKTQDLYAGSRILSRLIHSAGKAFKEEFRSGIIIFPKALTETQGDASLPNRFVAKLKEKKFNETELIEKAQNIKAAVNREMSIIAHESLKEAREKGASKGAIPQAFQEQIKSHLDIFWAFEPINNEEYAFAKAYRRLEQKVGAIKNVRPFEQYQYTEVDNDFEYAENFGERGRKCSVDGINNALFYREVTGEEERAYFDLASEASPLETFYLNPGEALSAVSFVKRFFPDTSSFPSTSEVALMYDETKLDAGKKECLILFENLFSNRKQNLTEACFATIKKLKIKQIEFNGISNINNNFDYQYLFEENINEKNFPNDEQRELLQALQQELKPFLKTRYYVLIHFDGDSMGQWLAGEYNKTKKDLEKFHETLSESLKQFAAEAQGILDNDQIGRTIYAGGDDFMGFVNIHHLFRVMKELRAKFHQIVDTGIEDHKENPDAAITFSAGIVIAHFKTPFSEVLKQVRTTEKLSKKIEGKNAFAITVLKHSGEIQEAVYKWGTGQQESTDNWTNLGRLIEFIATEEGPGDRGTFSNTFIQNLTVEFTQLTGYNLEDIDTKNRNSKFLDGALLKEIERLVSRSLMVFESKAKDNKRREELTSIVQSLWKEAPPPRSKNFIHALHVADFLTRKTKQ